MHYQQRCTNSRNMRQRIEPVPHQPSDRQIGIVVSPCIDSGRKGTIEDHRGDRPACRELNRDAAAKTFPKHDDVVRRKSLGAHAVISGQRINDQAALAGAAGRTTEAAITHHADAIAGRLKSRDAVTARGEGAGIAMKIEDRGLAGLGLAGPTDQLLTVRRLNEILCYSSEPGSFGRRAMLVRHEQQFALKRIDDGKDADPGQKKNSHGAHRNGVKAGLAERLERKTQHRQKFPQCRLDEQPFGSATQRPVYTPLGYGLKRPDPTYGNGS